MNSYYLNIYESIILVNKFSKIIFIKIYILFDFKKIKLNKYIYKYILKFNIT